MIALITSSSNERIVINDVVTVEQRRKASGRAVIVLLNSEGCTLPDDNTDFDLFETRVELLPIPEANTN